MPLHLLTSSLDGKNSGNEERTQSCGIRRGEPPNPDNTDFNGIESSGTSQIHLFFSHPNKPVERQESVDGNRHLFITDKS